MCEVIQAIKQEGFALGEQRGIVRGEKSATDKILSLFSKLRSSGKNDELDRAISDREYLKKLMDEYQK